MDIHASKNGQLIIVWESGPFLTARAQVGTRVFVVQGPPLAVQIAQDPDHSEHARCVADAVRFCLQFASLETRKPLR